MSGPLYAELGALNATPPPDVVADQADRVDLIIGRRNRGAAPYGTAFDQARQRIARAEAHGLPDQVHLAHIQAPADLGRLLDELAVT
ncbi:hypothetical protein [uncultured Streptomyces sp.]|uniref:hypothetical protein n=1 Tax=uncultured Streptomyces sp. TaxID=174707 RepID=UPI00260C9888|nr:hypothetical protein [uncultured Streptomyces sp.]